MKFVWVSFFLSPTTLLKTLKTFVSKPTGPFSPLATFPVKTSQYKSLPIKTSILPPPPPSKQSPDLKLLNAQNNVLLYQRLDFLMDCKSAVQHMR